MFVVSDDGDFMPRFGVTSGSTGWARMRTAAPRRVRRFRLFHSCVPVERRPLPPIGLRARHIPCDADERCENQNRDESKGF